MNHVLRFDQIDPTQVALAGGKGALLGELRRIAGIEVPDGFCVTTHAFARGVIDADLSTAVALELGRLGADGAYAVRSSATAEDSPTTSFAGQHDTYLNVTGLDAILEHIGRCWASLSSERAIAYRDQSGLDQRDVSMAVVVQRMVPARAAGVLFTADPITANRRVSAIEAVPGLGDSLVSGAVSADAYRVRENRVVDRTLVRGDAVLTDAQILRLEQLGRRIEAHLGAPQDIEWCLTDEPEARFQIVQSRPITTLFPIPEGDDSQPHVYVSVGHQQMMTDAMKPLGLSVWQLTALRPMPTAGGRLFVDVAGDLASPASRAAIIAALGRSDPLIGDALRTIVERDDFIPTLPDAETEVMRFVTPPPELEIDPAIVTGLIARNQESVTAAEREINKLSGPALIEFILDDLEELKRLMRDPQSLPVIMTAARASDWLNANLEEWLGERNAADTLSLSVPGNITAEMGLALLDVADAIRPHAEVVEFLRQAQDDGFLEELPAQRGGQQAYAAIRAYLDRYGMRCAGEIDITRPRWSERPTMLLTTLLDHVANVEPGAARRRFERGREAAVAKERSVLSRLRRLADGEQKAAEAKLMIDRVRTFSGYREYPKYGIVSRYFIYRRALLAEAGRLVEAGVLRDREDIFYLTLPEILEVVRAQLADHRLIRERRDAFASYAALTPPRVLTSEGEIITGSYRRDDVPAGALAGLAVSAGIVEGRARVILDMAKASLQAGDILVTRYTDPSWTPLFLAAGGLVTEVGGLMTHGAVIAREYGLPAVVGVEHATTLIRDGQRIRVNGDDGLVEVLPEPDCALPEPDRTRRGPDRTLP